MPKKTSLFALGTRLHAARIVRIIEGPTVSTSRYELQWDCCGETTDMTHPSFIRLVRGRKERVTEVCARCALKRGNHAGSAHPHKLRYT